MSQLGLPWIDHTGCGVQLESRTETFEGESQVCLYKLLPGAPNKGPRLVKSDSSRGGPASHRNITPNSDLGRQGEVCGNLPRNSNMDIGLKVTHTAVGDKQACSYPKVPCSIH